MKSLLFYKEFTTVIDEFLTMSLKTMHDQLCSLFSHRRESFSNVIIWNDRKMMNYQIMYQTL